MRAQNGEEGFEGSQQGGHCEWGERRLIFWNVAGIYSKDREFWDYVEGMDFVSLSETWVETGGWETLRPKLSGEFIWDFVAASRVHKRGRGKGGFLIGVRKGWFKGELTLIKEVKDGVVWSKLGHGREGMDIVSVYNSGDLNGAIRTLDSWEEREGVRLVIGGDFNIRLGGLGGNLSSAWERCSKDAVVSNEGRAMWEMIVDKGWFLLNGCSKGDACGEFTYTGARGSSVIDYIIVNAECMDDVISFKVGIGIESDHAPLELQICDAAVARKGRRNQEEPKYKEVYIWSEEETKKYQSVSKELMSMEATSDYVDNDWENLKCVIKSAMSKKVLRVKKWKIGQKKWWNSECSRLKRNAKKAARDARCGLQSRESYLGKKKAWKILCAAREKEVRESEKAELRSLKKEADVWKFLNRSRKVRVDNENEIKVSEWKEHFRKLLDGSDTEKCDVNSGEVLENWTGQIERSEMLKALGRLKKRKAAGIDGIPCEAWIFAVNEVQERLLEILKKVWARQGVPEDWKTAVIVPLFKKGDKNKTENYRGISLLPTAYKVYTEILRGRLEKEVKEKNILPEGQAGFRKGRSTMDNVFVLNHVVQREKARKGKTYALFVDLKAAFDSVNRCKLWKIMKDFGVSEDLVERIKDIYSETKCKVRTGEEFSDVFWTTKGLRQGCVLSPILFSIYIAGMEAELRERNVGGVLIGGVRVWSLAYADDIVLLAKNREALLDMMGSLGKFLRDRDLILNTGKTKVLVFGKSGRARKEKWVWDDGEIEEVGSFKYLGFTFNRGCDYEDHLRDLEKKAIAAARKTWGLGLRKCGENFGRRVMLFEYLVRSVMSYGVEIWGWCKREALERVQYNYFRGVLGLDKNTPGYIVRKETGTRELWGSWAIRAYKFEDKLLDLGDDRLPRKCLIEKVRDGCMDLYSKERESFYNSVGMSRVAIDIDRAKGRYWVPDLERREIWRGRVWRRGWERPDITAGIGKLCASRGRVISGGTGLTGRSGR